MIRFRTNKIRAARRRRNVPGADQQIRIRARVRQQAHRRERFNFRFVARSPEIDARENAIGNPARTRPRINPPATNVAREKSDVQAVCVGKGSRSGTEAHHLVRRICGRYIAADQFGRQTIAQGGRS